MRILSVWLRHGHHPDATKLCVNAMLPLTSAFENACLTLGVEQTFLNGDDTDKSNNHIEECICKKEPLLKVRLLADALGRLVARQGGA